MPHLTAAMIATGSLTGCNDEGGSQSEQSREGASNNIAATQEQTEVTAGAILAQAAERIPSQNLSDVEKALEAFAFYVRPYWLKEESLPTLEGQSQGATERQIAAMLMDEAVAQKAAEFASREGSRASYAQGNEYFTVERVAKNPRHTADALVWWATQLSKTLLHDDEFRHHAYALMLYEALIERINDYRSFAESMMEAGDAGTFSREILKAFPEPLNPRNHVYPPYK